MKKMHAYALSNQVNNGGITSVYTVSRDMRDSFAWYHVPRWVGGFFKGLRLTLMVSFEDNGCSEGRMRQQTIL